jgi:hypothetical protein
MGPDRDAAGGVDEVDRVVDGRERALAVGRLARDEIGDEEVGEVLEAQVGDLRSCRSASAMRSARATRSPR